MSGLERLVGDTPRVRIIEALVRLGEVPVTRAEIAKEADEYKTSTNRVIRELESEGIIRRVTRGSHPTYRANVESPVLKLSAHFIAALDLVTADGVSPAEAATVPDLVRAQLPRLLARESVHVNWSPRSATVGVPAVGQSTNFRVTA